MSLKLIYEKAPLKSAVRLPLRPGQVRMDVPALKTLMAELKGVENEPSLWEGAFRCAAILSGSVKPVDLPEAALILKAMEQQAEDGSLTLGMPGSLHAVRAAYAVYEATVDRGLLGKIMKWLGWVYANRETVLKDPAVRRCAADLLSLCEEVYRVTGKKAVLMLAELVQRAMIDWAGVLNTFAVQQPMAKVISSRQLAEGIAREEGSDAGFYTRQAMVCHGEALADGARAACLAGILTGNGAQLGAARKGWERISRWHGAICGGLHCDEQLAGGASNALIDAAALGAWAEALCFVTENDDEPWAYPELAKLLNNALPRTLLNGRVHGLLLENSLTEECSEKDAYMLRDGRGIIVRARLLRGYAAILSHAVTLTKFGADVNLLLPGEYRFSWNGQPVRMIIDDRQTITIRCREALKMPVSVRVPDWAEDAEAMLNGKPGKPVPAGKYVTILRTWTNGDTLSFLWSASPRSLEGHHQGQYVMLGDILYTMPAGGAQGWAMAAMGEAYLTESGEVKLPAAAALGWNRRSHVPADVPVLPETAGDALEVTLTPYAETVGISLFPKGRMA